MSTDKSLLTALVDAVKAGNTDRAREIAKSFDWEVELIEKICALDPNKTQGRNALNRIKSTLDRTNPADLKGQRFLEVVGDLELSVDGATIKAHSDGRTTFEPDRTGTSHTFQVSKKTADPVAIQAFVASLGTNPAYAEQGVSLQFQNDAGTPKALQDYTVEEVQQIAMAHHAAIASNYEIKNQDEIEALKNMSGNQQIFEDVRRGYDSYLAATDESPVMRVNHTFQRVRNAGKGNILSTLGRELSLAFRKVAASLFASRDALKDNFNADAVRSNAERVAEAEKEAEAKDAELTLPAEYAGDEHQKETERVFDQIAGDIAKELGFLDEKTQEKGAVIQARQVSVSLALQDNGFIDENGDIVEDERGTLDDLGLIGRSGKPDIFGLIFANDDKFEKLKAALNITDAQIKEGERRVGTLNVNDGLRVSATEMATIFEKIAPSQGLFEQVGFNSDAPVQDDVYKDLTAAQNWLRASQALRECRDIASVQDATLETANGALRGNPRKFLAGDIKAEAEIPGSKHRLLIEAQKQWVLSSLHVLAAKHAASNPTADPSLSYIETFLETLEESELSDLKTIVGLNTDVSTVKLAAEIYWNYSYEAVAQQNLAVGQKIAARFGADDGPYAVFSEKAKFDSADVSARISALNARFNKEFGINDPGYGVQFVSADAAPASGPRTTYDAT